MVSAMLSRRATVFAVEPLRCVAVGDCAVNAGDRSVTVLACGGFDRGSANRLWIVQERRRCDFGSATTVAPGQTRRVRKERQARMNPLGPTLALAA